MLPSVVGDGVCRPFHFALFRTDPGPDLLFFSRLHHNNACYPDSSTASFYLLPCRCYQKRGQPFTLKPVPHGFEILPVSYPEPPSSLFYLHQKLRLRHHRIDFSASPSLSLYFPKPYRLRGKLAFRLRQVGNSRKAYSLVALGMAQKLASTSRVGRDNQRKRTCICYMTIAISWAPYKS